MATSQGRASTSPTLDIFLNVSTEMHRTENLLYSTCYPAEVPDERLHVKVLPEWLIGKICFNCQ